MEKSSTPKCPICYQCKRPIAEWADEQIIDFGMVKFHPDCFNRYEHYYGLDKPID